jgi:hypothetical protein
VWAFFKAFAAFYAFVAVQHQLRCGKLTFGIMAPSAVQIAPLEKDGGADAGAVHKGGALDVKNGSGHIG